MLGYIDTLIEDPSIGKSRRDKFVAVRNSLERFLNGTPIDLLETAIEGWSDRYYDFLLDQYASRNGKITPCRARQIWIRFRGIIRQAIKGNLYPDIEIEPDRLFEARSGERRSPKRASAAMQLKRLREAAGSSSNKWCERYIAALALGGMELRDLMAVPVPPAGEKIITVRLPHYGMDVEVEPRLLQCLSVSTEKRSKGQKVVRHSDSGKVVEYMMRTGGIALYKAGNVFTDWLCIAKDNGVSDPVIREIVKLRFADEKSPSPVLADTIRQLIRENAGVGTRMHECDEELRWYAVKTIGKSPADVMDGFNLTMKRVKDLESSEVSERWLPAIDDGFYTPDTFIPYDFRKARDNERLRKATSVLSRIMFVRTRARDIRVFARMIDNARVYSRDDDGRKEYCAIHPGDIIRMRRTLNFIAGYEDDAESLFPAPTDAAPTDELRSGDRVKIAIPGYETYDVVVEREETDRDRKRMARRAQPDGGTRNYYLIFKCGGSLEIKLPFPRNLIEKLRTAE